MTPSFSVLAKDQLARHWPRRRCCLRAELTAFVRTLGLLRISGRHDLSLEIEVDAASLCRKIFRLMKSLYGVTPHVTIHGRHRLGRKRTYIAAVTGEARVRSLLDELMILEAGTLKPGINPQTISSDCCQRSFLRAVFLAVGSIANPDGGYHLEMIFGERLLRNQTAEILAKQGLSSAGGERRGRPLIYLKDAQEISDFLSVVGAHSALLQFEDARAKKEMRNRINRLVNADTANLEKTAAASARQLANIRYLQAVTGFRGLSPKLKELARLRLENPELNLRELGDRLQPKASKSAVNHRMRRLERLAETLRQMDTEN